jgi:hypothetical protein
MRAMFTSICFLIFAVPAFSQTNYYVNDNSTAGDIYTATVGNDLNAGTAAMPFATVSKAVLVAAAGDIIYVDAGIYTQQVTITKGLTIIGAGKNLTTITNNPAVTLLPPPGTFTEIGLIQTAQSIGDVHISNMSVSPVVGSIPYMPHPILIQSGGSVRDCKIMNGTVFFRVQYAEKSAVIENNTITAEYIGINCEGSGLTATLLNNTINVTSPYFSVGAFIGADGEGFSPIPQFTAIGNFLNSYVTSGFQVYSSNANITQNSFLGTGLAVQQQASSNILNATCNWYGTTNSATIASKMNGNITFNPWLTSGTDNNAATGFQPAAGTCSGRTNYYVNDNSRTGDVLTTAVGNNANNGSQAAPFATLSYAISQAAADDYIYIDAGAYAEQVIINKGITIIGAGQNLTLFTPPATTLVPAPGPFTEIGLFETTQNIGDVSVSYLSINSNNLSQNIIIQSGGVVRNCKLINGGQGVFFRVDPLTNPAAKSAVIEYNQIEPAAIGINCQGSNLTAFVTGNSITNTSPYYAGIFAGLDFGPLPTLYIFNNTLNNYSGTGMEVNSNTGFYMNNSLTGTNGSIAIRKSSGNTPTATCNWYGSADQNIAIAKIEGAVNYSPWLINGTDNSVAIGFQPSAACTGRQNKFYVNDNSQIGDVFTSAVGNDGNSGIPSAPLATISAAYNKAQAGDTIIIDAGTYNAVDGTIGKSLTILGSNYLISPNSIADPLLINSIRNAETNIDNTTWTIGANEINLEGLTFNPGAKKAILLNNTSFGNIHLFKNRFKINAVNTVIDFIGAGTINTLPSGIVNSGLEIAENRFEKYDATTGLSLNISRFRNVGIVSNTFVNVGATVRTQSVLGIGSSGAADGIYFANNNIDKYINAVGGNRFGSLFIIENKIHNTSNVLNSSNIITESSNVYVINNLLDGSAGVVPFIQYSRQGGSVAGSTSSITVENNIINGTAIPGTTSLLGSMNLIFFNSVLNPTLTVRGNTFNYDGNLSGIEGQYIRPIMIRGNLANATVEKNEITLSGTNLQPGNPALDLPVCPAITLYTDNGTTSSILPGSVINILNNKIHGFKHSFVAFDPGAGSTPYVGFGNIPENVTVNINNNSFTGDSISINNGTIGQQIQASCNWYGSFAIQDIRNKVSLPTVTYNPYLITGADIEPATIGFQPVPGSCNNFSITATVDSYTNVTCHGANNGTINITVLGGASPNAFAWTKDGDPLFISTVEDPANFGPGTYHLSITDALGTNLIMDENGNVITINVTITEPPVLTAAGSGTNISCFNGSNGTAAVVANGGTTPYSYLWSNGATTSSINGLVAGNYTVTVTDANGCTATSYYNVSQPPALNVTVTGTTASCNGSATANVTGGTSPYTYLWNNGATTQSISNVPAGAYSVVVTDVKGCTKSGAFTITGNSPINPITALVHVSCFGGSNGSITVTGAGGIAPRTYNLNGSTFQANNVFNNLPAGSYVVGVKDANGCSDFVIKTIMQPVLLTVALDSIRTTCFGVSGGRIYITPSGISAKTYSWTGPNGYTSTSQDPNNVAAGQYNVLVTDSKGCTTSLSAIMPSWPVINISEVVTNVACRNDLSGAIDVTVTGGTGSGFTYLWNNGATTQDRFNLAAGNNYRITVTDIGSGCSVLKRDTITQPLSALSVTVNNQSVVNVSGCNSPGSFTAQGSGGTVYPNPDLYRYSINGVNYQTSQTFSNLAAGGYTVTVKDANGCTATRAITISDNGSDEYEALLNSPNNSNNNKSKAAPISLGATISARIGTAGDIDYYKLSPANTWTGNYTLSFVQPSLAVSFYLMASNGTAIVPAADSSAIHKQYNNLSGTYFVRVSGSSSTNCYQFTVTTGAAARTGGAVYTENKKETLQMPFVLKALVYPNPHQGNFTLRIESPEDGMAAIEFFNTLGQKVTERNIFVTKGQSNTIYFTNIRSAVLLYRLRVGKYVVYGKILGPN